MSKMPEKILGKNVYSVEKKQQRQNVSVQYKVVYT